MARMLRMLHDFMTTPFSQLILFLVLLFVTRPYDRGMVYSSVWQLLFAAVVLMGIYNAHHHDRVKMAATLVGLPSVVLGWFALFFHSYPLILMHVGCTIVYIFIVAASIISRVILTASVTPETLRGTIVVYFLMAFGFSFIYYFVELVYPGSFRLLYADPSFFTHTRYLSEMMYFSFVTLLTIGYGDMTPRGDVAQTLAILEGICGTFYVALLVSRLVSVYTWLAHQQESFGKKARRIKKTPTTPTQNP